MNQNLTNTIYYSSLHMCYITFLQCVYTIQKTVSVKHQPINQCTRKIFGSLVRWTDSSLNSLQLRRRWHCKKIWIQTVNWRVKYVEYNLHTWERLVYYYQGVGNFEIVIFVLESGRKLVSYFSKFPGYHIRLIEYTMTRSTTTDKLYHIRFDLIYCA